MMMFISKSGVLTGTLKAEVQNLPAGRGRGMYVITGSDLRCQLSSILLVLLSYILRAHSLLNVPNFFPIIGVHPMFPPCRN